MNVNVYNSLKSSKTHVTDFVPGVLWCVLRHLDGTQLRPVTQLDLMFGLDKMKESKQATVTADPTNLREVPLDWTPLALHLHTHFLSRLFLSALFFRSFSHFCCVSKMTTLHYNEFTVTHSIQQPCLCVVTMIIIVYTHTYFRYDYLLGAYCVEADIEPLFGFQSEK